MKVIITGASGMVGEGVLHECLLDPGVTSVLVVGRSTCGITHPKLHEILRKDLFDITAIESSLAGCDACFFCLGISSIGMKEAAYKLITYDLTLNFAQTLCRLNPQMTFCYVSGKGTDSTEKGRLMWARVKGKTENDLAKLPFKKVYNFRPGFMLPTKGLSHAHAAYKYVNWMFPLMKVFAPGMGSTLREMGLAMIHSVDSNYPKEILEVKDIIALAKGR